MHPLFVDRLLYFALCRPTIEIPFDDLSTYKPEGYRDENGKLKANQVVVFYGLSPDINKLKVMSPALLLDFMNLGLEVEKGFKALP